MSKITRKSYKRKKIIMGAVLFGGIGLVSTGFAAWVLSNSVTDTKETSMSVGTIDDKNMEFDEIVIKNLDDVESSVFVFEPAKNDNGGRVRWDGENYENLTLTVSGKILHAQNLGNVHATLTYVSGGILPDGVNYENSVDAAISSAYGYVVAPEAYRNDVTLWSAGADVSEKFHGEIEDSTVADQTFSFTYTVQFTWGTTFGGVNPSLYYDADGAAVPQGDASSDAHSETVAGKLKGLHDMLDGVKLNLTLTANPNS